MKDPQTTPQPPGAMTTADVATRYQVTTRTVANWRASGKIPFMRITTRCIRYKIADVEAALSK